MIRKRGDALLERLNNRLRFLGVKLALRRSFYNDPPCSWRRLFRHMFNAGCRPSTVLDAGKNSITHAMFRVLGTVNYVHFPSEASYPDLFLVGENMDAGGTPEGRADLFNLDAFCMERGLTPPYVLRIARGGDWERVLEGAKGVLERSELVAVDVPIPGRGQDGAFERLRTTLSGKGLVLYDIWGAPDRTAFLDEDRFATFVFIRKGGNLDAPLAVLREMTPAGSPAAPEGPAPWDSMKSCLVLGSGRSGTSMLSGILYEAGYYMGEELYIGRETNPKGFFECAMINYLNEDILRRYDGVPTVYSGFKGPAALAGRHNPRAGQRWLCALGPEVRMETRSKEIHRRIREACSRTPFAYKDPRFSYTLPLWLPYLPPDAQLLCIFRDPGITVRSILKEAGSMAYLAGLKIDEEIAYEVYRLQYQRVLDLCDEVGERLVFIHYDQVFDGSAVPRLSKRLGVKLSARFVDPRLKRTKPEPGVPGNVSALYKALCARAGYHAVKAG